MSGLIQPTPVTQEPDTSQKAILVATGTIVVLALIVAFLLRAKPQPPTPVPPYAAELKLSDLKMSQAQNFVGASVTYLDGVLANAGNKTVTHITVRVTFKDFSGEVAQVEEVPVSILRTSGPYADTVDLSVVPLAPGQSKPFRLIFERVRDEWNQAYPDLQITNVGIR